MNKYDRVMKKVYKFYDNPKVEETYALDYSIVRILIPRLKLFVEKSNDIINWDEHTRYANIDVIQTCKNIIDDFTFYLNNSDIDDIETYKKCKFKLQHGFNLLGEVITHLGW